jgi:hypothetical protein
MAKLVHPELSYQVRGVLLNAYNKLGPLLKEEYYRDAIRSMTKKFLPEFVPLLPLYEQWAADPSLVARDRRSVESAVKTLRRMV